MRHRAFQSTWARCQAQQGEAVAVERTAGVAQDQLKTVALTVVLMPSSVVCEIAKSH